MLYLTYHPGAHLLMSHPSWNRAITYLANPSELPSWHRRGGCAAGADGVVGQVPKQFLTRSPNSGCQSTRENSMLYLTYHSGAPFLDVPPLLCQEGSSLGFAKYVIALFQEGSVIAFFAMTRGVVPKRNVSECSLKVYGSGTTPHTTS